MTSVERNEPWQQYLRSRFPAYLLPESAAHRLSRSEAIRFLEDVTGRSDALELLRAASLFATHVEELREFVQRDLVDVVRALNSRTLPCRRKWVGGYHGRLHIKDTLLLHMQGDIASFVTLSQNRVYDLPENILLRSVCKRMLSLLIVLRESGVLREGVGWGSMLSDCEVILRRVLASSMLRTVTDRNIGAQDENAARAARHVAYHRAAAWIQRFDRDLDADDAARIATVVAGGALLPLSPSTGFELAVLIRLAETLESELLSREPGRWHAERGIVHSGRRDVYALVRDDGLAIRVHYNQSTLPAGKVDKGRRYYLQTKGRLRPDLTLVFERHGTRFNAVVVECKESEDPGVLMRGYLEAHVYLVEYEEHLRAQPKAILVSSGQIDADPDPDHDVLAEGWNGWPSRGLTERLAMLALAS